ncbi:hypothetical protein H0H93_011124 [Arthromyces matolae]|nr:hypothetical protein H0H93_011124 [Arthromyces matolae]
MCRPEFARYVRHVTETGERDFVNWTQVLRFVLVGTVHRGLMRDQGNITENTLKALALCVNLESMTWVDDSTTSDFTLLSFIAVIRLHPLQQLSIRTHSDIGDDVWSKLITLTGLRKISIWSMDGPPRVLQGWSDSLGGTLTHLELGRCTGVPPTILISVLSQLPMLRDLRLKGAAAHTIPTILSYLPHLRSLDTEYPGSYASRPRNATDPTVLPPNFPTLHQLIVRAGTMDRWGPQALWGWIRGIVPKTGLRSLDLRVFAIDSDYTGVPRIFILDLARIHGSTLKQFRIGEAQLLLNDIECLCIKFPNLETLVCATASADIESIVDSVAEAKNLRTLRLFVQWMPSARKGAKNFTSHHARDLMLRTEDSRLREIAIGSTLYKGKWILQEPEDEGEKGELVFRILADLAEASWKM